ncbi:MAG: ABC transporter permease [Chloroflexi bacterium]|nr:MAG: ABC transporter permease [Chloroflexota bacterium]
MLKYTVRRLIQGIPTFFGITVLSYMLMLAAPGNPIELLTFDPNISVEAREKLAIQAGLNDPWPLQYLTWLIGNDWRPVDMNANGVLEEGEYGVRQGILRGDFGRSFFYKRAAITVIGDRIPATLELGVAALITSLVLGIPIGVIAAIRRGGIFDNFSRVMAVVFNAVPSFWLGIMMILFFGSILGLLPMNGRCGTVLVGGCPPLYARLEYLLMPTFVLAAGGIAGYSRYMRTSMLETISRDYIRTAHAKGLPGRTVWFKHAARNAMIPIATFLGPALTGLWGGAVITERVFGWPGVGRLAVEAVTQRDYPVVMAIVILGAVSTIIGYIVSDILYALIDPRIRFS